MSAVIERGTGGSPVSRAPEHGRDARATSKPICKHCGAPLVDARMVEPGFCCAGCSYVFRLVHERGLAGYYRIKDEITTPADAAVFQARDYAWLVAAQRTAEESATGRPPELTLDLQGVSCAGCVWLIERLFQQQAGGREIVANAQLGTLRLRWVRGEFDATAFARVLQTFGYLVGPLGEARGESESRMLVKKIGLCAAFAMNVMLFAFPVYFGMGPDFEYARLFGLLSLAFGTLSLLVGGVYFLGRAARALRMGAMHIDLPIGIGIAGAYAGSLYGWFAEEERFVYFDFVSGFILLMLIGRWAQVAAVERNQRRLLALQPKPPRVLTVDAGEVAPEALRVGQSYDLATGQTNPVEASLDAGATFSLASINGEAEPRVFQAGARVPAGAVNVGRVPVRLTARQTWNESLLAQLLQTPERAGARNGLIERIVRSYIVGILVVATVAGIGWWIGTGDGLRTWAVVTAVLVVSCPCAVALAFPLADELATVALRRCGVFVRAGDLWTKLGRVRHIVFDKTGTLTLETPVLKNPESIRTLGPEARAALLALVRDNPHPVSQSLLENLLTAGTVEPLSGEVKESVGWGVELGLWSLGRVGWKTTPTNGICRPSDYPLPEMGATILACDGRIVAAFGFTDTVRADAKAEIAALRRRGFAVQILSGDQPEKVAALAGELGLPAASGRGGLSPRDKAAWFEHEGRADSALMLGDGANDSLAFDRALCRGTPVIHRGLLEQKADFYYLGRGIGGIRALFEVDAVRRRTQTAILVFSVAYNVLAVGLAVAGKMNPLVAAILMPVNSLATLAIVTGGMRRVFRARR